MSLHARVLPTPVAGVGVLLHASVVYAFDQMQSLCPGYIMRNIESRLPVEQRAHTLSIRKVNNALVLAEASRVRQPGASCVTDV